MAPVTDPGVQGLKPPFAAFSGHRQAAGLEVEQPGLKLAPLWDATGRGVA